MPDVFMSVSGSQVADAPAKSGVLEENALASLQNEQSPWREEWDTLVDHTLIEWGRDVSALNDPEENLQAPTRAALMRSFDVTRILRNAGMPPPLRIAPNGEGGIVFERQDGKLSEVLEVFEDGRTELCVFRDHRLQSRGRFL